MTVCAALPAPRCRCAEDGGGANPDEADEEEQDEEEAVPVDKEPDTPEAWSAWACGLAVLCRGLACAVQLEQCELQDVEAVFEPDMLVLMWEAAPTDDARCAHRCCRAQSRLL